MGLNKLLSELHFFEKSISITVDYIHCRINKNYVQFTSRIKFYNSLSFYCLLNLERCLWMRSAFSNMVNDEVKDGGFVLLSTFTSSSALEWELHSDRLLSTTACLIRATYTAIKKENFKILVNYIYHNCNFSIVLTKYQIIKVLNKF